MKSKELTKALCPLVYLSASCQYVYLSVCIEVCPCVCLVSLAWLCLPLLGSAWLCLALRACLAVLRSVWLCLAQKSYGSLWELMEAFFFEIKA